MKGSRIFGFGWRWLRGLFCWGLLGVALQASCTPEPPKEECNATRPCPGELRCLQSRCACPGGQTRCGESCVDLSAAPSHCGSCQAACRSGESCKQGQCQDKKPECPEGFGICEGKCADLRFHPLHCGRCANACQGGTLCRGGECLCAPGLQRCGSRCVELSIHPEHCGACDKACGPGRFCAEGRCLSSCPGKTQSCVGGCIDYGLHPQHCGGCTKACAPGQICSEGKCVCPGGWAACDGGGCFDLQSDPQHCGGCNKTCAGGQVCGQGRCVKSCPKKTPHVCAGGCYNTQKDPFHCGRCHRSCPPGVRCEGGQCATPQGLASQWAIGLQSSDQATGLAALFGKGGELYIAGEFQGAIGQEGKKLRSKGGRDIFVARFSPQGQLEWLATLGSAFDDIATRLAFDGKGQLLVAGSLGGGAKVGTTTVKTQGADIFLGRLDPAKGTWLSAISAGSAQSDIATDMAVDGAGAIYLTGQFGGSMKLGTTTLVAQGGSDIFVARLSASGQWQWAQRAGSNASKPEAATALALDPTGGVLLAGLFYNSASFGSKTTLSSLGASDIFVAKLSASGQWQWARNAGSPDGDAAYGIAVGSAGEVFLTGSFRKRADFGGIFLQSAGGADLFVAKLDAQGQWKWAKRAGSSQDAQGHHIAVGAKGQLYVTGLFKGSLRLGSLSLSANGSSDIFVALLDPQGAWLSGLAAGGPNTDAGRALSLGPNGEIALTGMHSGPAQFPGAALQTPGPSDAFAWKLEP